MSGFVEREKTPVYVRRCRCDECGKRIRFDTDYYVLKNPIWNLAMTGRRSGRSDNTCSGADGMLHIACVEKRIGRPLTVEDFIDCLVNSGVFGFNIERFPETKRKAA